MLEEIKNKLYKFTFGFLDFPEELAPPTRYRLMRRNMIILGLLGTILPLLLMALINQHQYKQALRREMLKPIRALANKTKHSLELFLAERVSTVKFITSAYNAEELADMEMLNHIFKTLNREIGGFIDIGLINAKGVQVSYTGPYSLSGKDYSKQEWFHEVKVKGVYVSDVFLGYRKFPHIAIAVKKEGGCGGNCFLRVTISTDIFKNIIASMELDPESDAFIINRKGTLQTDSKFHGKVLEKCSLKIPTYGFGTNIQEYKDPNGEDIFIACSYFKNLDYILVVVQPKSRLLRAWYTFKSEIFFIFVISVLAISVGTFKFTDILVKHIQESDEKREIAFREMQHTQKLSSIGRLAAGVAHEINNPLAIISEKAGLMKDLIENAPDFPNKEKFTALISSILQSVDRCSKITHRLLGFARRLDIEIEPLDVNEVIKETLGFLEKEALYRNIRLELHLAKDLPRIASDRGQLQQVFLNILNNAFAAVEDGGEITITTWDEDLDTIGVSIQDNGVGMSEETLRHIFEPFFTTKKGYGTGLGLPITYGIIKKLGGDIKVRSKIGKGTTFTIYIPKKPRKE